MNLNDNSANNGFTVTSSEGISQGAVEGVTTSSAAIVPKADTSSPPLRIAGAITPEGEIVPVPTDPTIPRSPFNIVNPVTHEVFIQLTGQSDNSTAVTANAPPLSVGGSPPTQPLFRQLSYEEWKALAETPPGISSTAVTANAPPLSVGGSPPTQPLFRQLSYEEWKALAETPPGISSTAETVYTPYVLSLDLWNYAPIIRPPKFFTHQVGKLEENERLEIIQSVVSRRLVVKINSTLYMRYGGGIYVPYNKDDVLSMILSLIIAEYNIEPSKSYSVCNDILNEALLRVDVFNCQLNDERYTFFLNGYVNNIDGRISGYVYDYFPTMQVEAMFLGLKKPLNHPLTDQFFDTIAGGDKLLIKRLWQIFGYCISSDGQAKVIIILYGASGDNGKSTFLSFLQSFITPTGVKNLSMKNLVGSRFSMSELANARLNISADEGAINLNSEAIGRLKNLSGHDYINADVKNKNQIRFLSTCKIVIASNNDIGLTYSTIDSAFKRRVLMVPFDVSIPKEEQDPQLLRKLRSEMSDVATEAMRHYLELRHNQYQFAGSDQFDKCDLFSPSSELYNMIGQFSRSHCVFDGETFTTTQSLYEAFCEEHGNIFKDDSAFSRAFKRYNDDKVKKLRKHTANTNKWGFYGVRLKEVL